MVTPYTKPFNIPNIPIQITLNTTSPTAPAT